MDDPHDHRPHDGPADREQRPTAPRRMAGRGGGPPGGSAFDRAARTARDAGSSRTAAAEPVRRIRATPATQVVFESLDRSEPTAHGTGSASEEDGRFDAVESLFDPTWITSADPSEPAGEHADADGSTATAAGQESHTAGSARGTSGATKERRMFPGGHVRLPPLGAADDNLHFVGTAFVRRNEERTTADRSAFDEYFTFESLFEEPTEASTEDGPLNPYGVLGVEPGSPWRDVVSAHRKLVKLHHPDRLVDADRATIDAAEERLRQINWAYGELGRSRQQ